MTTTDSPRSPTRSIDRFPLRHPNGSHIVGEGTIAAAIAIAEAVFARGGEPPPRTRLEWLGVEMEDLLARSGTRSRLVLTLMIWLVTILAPLFVGRLTKLGDLTLPERIRALLLLEHRFGEPLLAVKAMLCLLYYEHEDAAREVSFDGRCLVPPARLAEGRTVR